VSSLQSRPGHWLLRCPFCKSRFTSAAGAFVCRNGHSFDLAREGYVNLLSGGSRHPAAGGDSSPQLRHRMQFLGAGHLDALTTTIVRQVELSARGTQHVVDAGSGTGHHLARASTSLIRRERRMASISPKAIRSGYCSVRGMRDRRRSCGSSSFAAS
jgi:23S rRNA (guanine745-N1)-methyltransferase